ncbi:hypothetical protein JCM9279_001183 [Rhodotorula babjevae]
MLVCLVGPPQAGKDSLAQHLVAHHSFTRVHLGQPSSSSSSSTNALSFSSTSDFLDHATRTWRVDYVTTALTSRSKLVEFAKRPFVAIVHVDAPLGVRFKRAVARARRDGRTPPSLDEFVERDDLLHHGSLPLEPPRARPDDDDDDDAEAQGAVQATPADSPPSPTRTPGSPARLVLTPDPSPELYRSTGTGAPTLAPSSPAAATAPAADPTDALLSSILPLASLVLPNPYPSLAPFLSSLSLPHLLETLRPSWDTYFMLLASLASLRSNCMKRRVGAVLVRDKRVVSTGYNGTPRGVTNCGEGGCARCNSHGDGWALAAPSSSSGSSAPGAADGDGAAAQGAAAAAAQAARARALAAPPLNRVGEALDECLCLHAEENALLEAGRERVSGGGTLGAVLYCNTCPCLRCTVKIVQCGVREVVYSLSYSMDAASRRVMSEAGVVLRQMPQPPFPR